MVSVLSCVVAFTTVLLPLSEIPPYAFSAPFFICRVGYFCCSDWCLWTSYINEGTQNIERLVMFHQVCVHAQPGPFGFCWCSFVCDQMLGMKIPLSTFDTHSNELLISVPALFFWWFKMLLYLERLFSWNHFPGFRGFILHLHLWFLAVPGQGLHRDRILPFLLSPAASAKAKTKNQNRKVKIQS